MDETDRLLDLADRRDITNLRYSYSHAIDACEWERWGDLFCADGVWNPRGRSPQEGPDEIREFGETELDEEYLFTFHEALLPAITLDGDEATGEWYLRFTYADHDGVAGVKFGRYRDRYCRTEDGWKFAEVRAEITAHSGTTFGYDVVADDYYERDVVRFRVDD